jgi:hypothetical protein
MDSQFVAQVCRYIQAKDGHKPHLMDHVFAQNATLEMKVSTANISFPPIVSGLPNITETLVRDFHKLYENVYTICLTDTLQQDNTRLSCRWLVGMTEKSSGLSRVGYGDYQWIFTAPDSNLVSRLTIVIDNMIVLSLADQAPVMSWLEALSYPWSSSSEVLAAMPHITLLNDVRDHLIK